MKYLRVIDDERREPMGLADGDRCHNCNGAITRTFTPGLCWSCMPCALAS
jgi:hypothetical protein